MHAKLRALAWMPCWSAVAGVAAGCLTVHDIFDCLPLFGAWIAMTVLAYRWCDSDARLRRYAHWDVFVPAPFVCPGPLVVVPAYLMASRRARCLRSLTLAALYVFVLIAVAIVSRGAGVQIAGHL